VQKQHDLANLFCLLPCVCNPLPALGSDPINGFQIGSAGFDYAQDFGSEPLD
jgi:hypothetical protein